MDPTFVGDDRTLLRAIELVEDDLASGQIGLGAGILRGYVVDKASFDVIKANEHLRTLLKTFLQLNITVAAKRKEEPKRTLWTRAFGRSRQLSYQNGLDHLVAQRDQAFKAYEMLRRLTCWDNKLLVRLCS